jgi:RNA 2',3'-cyclic 3'-phosphodiesterase
VRLFFAAWPPRATAHALANWGQKLRGRPVPVQNIHLTLAFLGVADPHRAAAAAGRVKARAHELPIEAAKYWRHNHIVWVGPRDTPAALTDLVAALHLELFRAGFFLERRPFAAHISLVRKAQPPHSIAPLPALAWPVTEFTLVRSTVSASGSTYHILQRFPLDP